MTDQQQIATTQGKQLSPIAVLRERLLARSEELRAALGEIRVEQFIRAVVTSAQINVDILACSWQSVWLSCMRSCRDGLLPDGVEAALVPYKGNCQYIPMYQGLLRRFRRSGQFKWITANIVRKGEVFEHYIDETGEHFKHVPGDNDDTAIIKIYALALTKDGALFVTVIPIAEADRIRAFSKAQREDAPWKLWPEEMYRKTALRRLSKVLPSVRDILPPSEEEERVREVAAVLGNGPALIADESEADSGQDKQAEPKKQPEQSKQEKAK